MQNWSDHYYDFHYIYFFTLCQEKTNEIETKQKYVIIWKKIGKSSEANP